MDCKGLIFKLRTTKINILIITQDTLMETRIENIALPASSFSVYYTLFTFI